MPKIGNYGLKKLVIRHGGQKSGRVYPTTLTVTITITITITITNNKNIVVLSKQKLSG